MEKKSGNKKPQKIDKQMSKLYQKLINLLHEIEIPNEELNSLIRELNIEKLTRTEISIKNPLDEVNIFIGKLFNARTKILAALNTWPESTEHPVRILYIVETREIVEIKVHPDKRLTADEIQKLNEYIVLLKTTNFEAFINLADRVKYINALSDSIQVSTKAVAFCIRDATKIHSEIMEISRQKAEKEASEKIITEQEELAAIKTLEKTTTITQGETTIQKDELNTRSSQTSKPSEQLSSENLEPITNNSNDEITIIEVEKNQKKSTFKPAEMKNSFLSSESIRKVILECARIEKSLISYDSDTESELSYTEFKRGALEHSSSNEMHLLNTENLKNDDIDCFDNAEEFSEGDWEMMIENTEIIHREHNTFDDEIDNYWLNLVEDANSRQTATLFSGEPRPGQTEEETIMINTFLASCTVDRQSRNR